MDTQITTPLLFNEPFFYTMNFYKVICYNITEDYANANADYLRSVIKIQRRLADFNKKEFMDIMYSRYNSEYDDIFTFIMDYQFASSSDANLNDMKKAMLSIFMIMSFYMYNFSSSKIIKFRPFRYMLEQSVKMNMDITISIICKPDDNGNYDIKNCYGCYLIPQGEFQNTLNRLTLSYRGTKEEEKVNQLLGPLTNLRQQKEKQYGLASGTSRSLQKTFSPVTGFLSGLSYSMKSSANKMFGPKTGGKNKKRTIKKRRKNNKRNHRKTRK